MGRIRSLGLLGWTLRELRRKANEKLGPIVVKNRRRRTQKVSKSIAEMEQEGGVTASSAVVACSSMAVLYVAVLYAPTFILRLPPPNSYHSFLIRRFVCAAVASLISLIATAYILPIRWQTADVFNAYGMRLDHVWQALILPLSLTSLMYAGSFTHKVFDVINSCKKHQSHGERVIIDFLKSIPERLINWIYSMASNVTAWRNYIVAPVTEELVFRACMLPLLLCGGFKTYAAVFLCPVLFSLAHLNHMLEIYIRKDYSWLKASMAVGFQLAYTVVFGSYACFLFVRTGHLIAPLIAHVFCNYMGLPVIYSRKTGVASLGFVAGFLGFIWLLFPLTSPDLYNHSTQSCKCWHRFCT